jgi:hypothetical protein
MGPHKARWIATACAATLGASAIALACGSFDAASSDADADGAAADALAEGGASPDGVAPPDGGAIDAGACAKALFRRDEDFSFQELPAPWFPEKKNGTLAFSPPPDVDGGSAGNALRAFVTVPNEAEAHAYAFAYADFDLRPRWVDVAYRVLLPASGAYAELGCDIALLDKTPGETLGAIFHLLRYTSGELRLGWSAHDGDGGKGDGSSPLGLQVGSPVRWYDVRLRIDTTPADGGTAWAKATMTVTDTNTGLTSTAVSPDVTVAGANDSIRLACGFNYVDQFSGTTEVAVDDLAITACPE